MSVRVSTRAQSSEQRIEHRLNEQVMALEAVKINGASHRAVASPARGGQPSSECGRPLSKVPSLFKYFPPRKGRVEIPVRIFPGELVLLIRALLILNISPDEFSSEDPVRGA